MSIELPVRPASRAVEQATEMVESGVARAGTSLGTVFDRIGEIDLGELDLDESVREAAGRLRSQAEEVLKDLDTSSERDRLALVASTVFVVVFVAAFVLFMRRRGNPASKPTKKAAPRRGRG